MEVLADLGAAIAGSEEAASKKLAAVFERHSLRGKSRLWKKGEESWDYMNTAAINAAFVHAQDFDDLHNASIVHPGAITIPAAIAIGEEKGLSGRDVLLAIVLGYDAAARLGEAINPAAYYFWHTTGVVGSFSSAAAAGKLMGLDTEQMQDAFGSAGTQSSGLWAFNSSGANSKLLHVANAAICGIRSAELAAEGFTGAKDIIENKKGFVHALSTEPHLEKITDKLGSYFEINGNSFKAYACCRHTHSAIYAVEQIKKKHNIDPSQIEKIQDYTYRTAINTADNSAPANPYAAKFSIQYCICAAMLYGETGLRVFSEDSLADAATRALMERTEVIFSQEIEDRYLKDSNRWGHRLIITMKDGSLIEEYTDYPFGDFNNPFTWEDAKNKYMMLAEPVIGKENAERLYRKIREMDSIIDINQLFIK
jgi:2-methylcitrate dehydratase PrpD